MENPGAWDREAWIRFPYALEEMCDDGGSRGCLPGAGATVRAHAQRRNFTANKRRERLDAIYRTLNALGYIICETSSDSALLS